MPNLLLMLYNSENSAQYYEEPFGDTYENFPNPVTEFRWTASGKTFASWNKNVDGSGVSYSVGETIPSADTYYAIWEGATVNYIATSTDLTSVANAIRAKGGTSTQLAFPTEFISAIEAFPSSGDYTLQSKSVTPTKSQQNITPDSGYYGLSSVAVAAIPNTYQDVTSVTAVASHVLASDIFVNSVGQVITGTMTTLNSDYVTWDEWSEDSAWSDVDHTAYVYNLPVGYNSQQKSFFIDAEIRTVTPATSTQVVQASSFDLLQKVTVNPIPSIYGDISNDTAKASHVLYGYKAHTKSTSGSAVQITGTMSDYTGYAGNILDFDYYESSPSVEYIWNIPQGYFNNGTVTIVATEKTITPTTSTQTIEAARLPSDSFIEKVTVNPIPSIYGDTSTDTATASHILSGYKAHTKSGSSATQVTGTIPIYNGELVCTVNISLTNPVASADFIHCFIFDSNENKIGEITTPTGSTTINIPENSIIGIDISGTDPFIDEDWVNCSGDVSYIGYGWDSGHSYTYEFQVDGSGTIVLDGIPWG